MCTSRGTTTATGSVVLNGRPSEGRPNTSTMEAGVPHDVPLTGDATVDAALTALETLDGRRLPEHVTVFEAIHAALAERLAET